MDVSKFRMEIWHQNKCWSGSLPPKYHEMSLNDIHQSVGIGRQKFTAPYAFKLRNIEVVRTFENEIIFRDFEPVTEYFPAQWAPDQIPRDKAGTTTIEYVAPVGKLSIAYEVAESMESEVALLQRLAVPVRVLDRYRPGREKAVPFRPPAGDHAEQGRLQRGGR